MLLYITFNGLEVTINFFYDGDLLD